jgi:hypothetical protein
MHESISDLGDFLAKHTRVVILFINPSPDSQPCTTASTIFDELEGLYPDIEFVKLSTTDKENAKLFAKYGTGKVPFFSSFKDGKKSDNAVSVNKPRIEALMKHLTKE